LNKKYVSFFAACLAIC